MEYVILHAESQYVYAVKVTQEDGSIVVIDCSVAPEDVLWAGE